MTILQSNCSLLRTVLFADTDTGIRTGYRVRSSIKNVNSIKYVVHSNN